MTDHEDCSRGFYRSSKAWYAEVCKDRLNVNFGMYHKYGGTSGEMSIEWIDLNNRLVPRLQAFSDSWSALSLFPDLIQELAKVDSKDITEDQFVVILKKCGFQDLTPYEREGKIENKLQQELYQLEKRASEIKKALKIYDKTI